MTARPPLFPSWCTGNPNGIIVPSSAQQSAGWVPSEPPPAQVANWLANTTDAWLRYLDAQSSSTILASSLDFSTRLIGGGAFSYTGTTLAWSAPFYIAVPSAADGNNTVAAGSVSVPAGSVAYVTANMPFSTQATTTSGSAQLTNVLYADMAVVGQTVTGSGIPDGTQISAIGSDGQSITLSANATTSASGVSVTFSSSGVLPVQVAASATFVPGPNTVIFARGLGATCILGIGSGQMLLRQGEQKQLLGHGFASSANVTAGAAIAALAPVYLSPGATDAGRTPAAAYPLNASSSGTSATALFVGFASAAAAAGSPVEVVQVGKLSGFSGLVPGLLYYASSAPGSITTSKTSVANEWVVPIGIALSTTQMYVLAGRGAQQNAGDQTVYGNLSVNGTTSSASFSSAVGFKQTICMGTYNNTATSGATQSTTIVTYDYKTGNMAPIDRNWVAPRPGSITALQVVATSTPASAGLYTILKNNSPLTTAGHAGDVKALKTFAKGTYTFTTGDIIRITANYSASPTSSNVQANVDLEIETGA